MVVTTRSRYIASPNLTGRYDRWIFGNPWYGNDVSRTYGSRQVTTSEGHKWPIKRSDKYDSGGEFETVKSRLTASYDLTEIYHLGSHGNEYYVGNLIPYVVSQDWALLRETTPDADLKFWSDPMHSPSDLVALGTTAISNTIPTNPVVDASVSIAELLREGIPNLLNLQDLQERLSILKFAGSNYLNWEFGWKPLVSDLQKAAKAISDTEKTLLQLQRDSGKRVRRKFRFHDAVNTSTSVSGNPGTLMFESVPLTLMGQSSHTTTAKDVHKTWFSGSYTFDFEPDRLSELSRIATQARLLYGLELNPEVLWNLAPWSWLVDWFLNVGPVLHNMSAFTQDGLVLHYGYLMHHAVRSNTYSASGFTFPKGGDFPFKSIATTFDVESKRRVRATPYGFGLVFDSFSVRQLAILTALGLTR